MCPAMTGEWPVQRLQGKRLRLLPQSARYGVKPIDAQVSLRLRACASKHANPLQWSLKDSVRVAVEQDGANG
jgi:hypothetical protein